MTTLERAIHLRFHFAGQTGTNEDYDPKLYVYSSWTPPPWTLPPVVMKERLHNFSIRMNKLFRRRKGLPNLLPHQNRALSNLTKQQTFLICPCDKNLGPAIIERHDYLRIAFKDHLNDKRTYRLLSTSESKTVNSQMEQALVNWLKTYHKSMTKMERTFLKNHLNDNKNRFAKFYITLKAHKLKPGQNVNNLKSRPIVSCPGSLFHHLGIWVDRKLQELAKQQTSYFKNSFELRQQLTTTTYPKGAKLFTADAISMYTNIPTHTAIKFIAQTIRRSVRETRPQLPKAIISALKLVMTNNVFTFGNLTFKQLNGTAMGTPPAPPYATLYYGIHEQKFLSKVSNHVIFYKRFIDDVLGIWLPHPNKSTNERLWLRFQEIMNKHPGLTWEFTNPSNTVDFMDLTISIKDGTITTSLYEKPMNLHLYIPPHSAHPPGLLPGIVHSTLFRIFTLCSNNDDRILRTRLFFKRLVARGYKSKDIKPLFHRAISRARQYHGPMDKTMASNNVYLHLPYHPNDPESYKIQQAWRNTVATPPYQMPLSNMKNPKTKEKCNIDRMVIAYRRPMNLGNLLSHRNIEDTPMAPSISSYYIT